jgi:hypothetical protein
VSRVRHVRGVARFRAADLRRRAVCRSVFPIEASIRQRHAITRLRANGELRRHAYHGGRLRHPLQASLARRITPSRVRVLFGRATTPCFHRLATDGVKWRQAHRLLGFLAPGFRRPGRAQRSQDVDSHVPPSKRQCESDEAWDLSYSIRARSRICTHSLVDLSRYPIRGAGSPDSENTMGFPQNRATVWRQIKERSQQHQSIRMKTEAVPLHQ